VKRLIAGYNASIDDEIFTGNVSLIITFLKADIERFEAELTKLTAGRVEPILLSIIDD
jgi:hypothetical protein